MEDQTIITSTNRYLSLELSDLMPLINDNEAFTQEDQTYLQAALEHVSTALDLKRTEDFAGAMKAVSKAVRQVGELVTLRKQTSPTYEVLEAPFLYQQGNILLTYIEVKSDVFGNVAPLEVEETESEESEEEEDAAEEQPAEGEAKLTATEPVPKVADPDEPRIEEEKKESSDDKEEEKVAAGDDEKEDGEANSATMLEDVSESFQAAIQLLGDFITGSLGGCSQRKELVANLLIDTHIRFGDASMFREDILGAVE
jgi:hypothetical protein